MTLFLGLLCELMSCTSIYPLAKTKSTTYLDVWRRGLASAAWATAHTLQGRSIPRAGLARVAPTLGRSHASSGQARRGDCYPHPRTASAAPPGGLNGDGSGTRPLFPNLDAYLARRGPHYDPPLPGSQPKEGVVGEEREARPHFSDLQPSPNCSYPRPQPATPRGNTVGVTHRVTQQG